MVTTGSNGSVRPGVTVVVPVYNPGPYLERTVASLLAQRATCDRYDVIFVDDGSTDGTGARLDDLAARHPELIAVEHIENSGWAGRPRNVGTALSAREYVFYCDADDWLPDGALEAMLTRAEADGSDIVLGRSIGNRRSPPLGLYERGDYCTDWRSGPGILNTLTSQRLFRREFLSANGITFPEGRVRLEDFIFMTQAYLAAQRVSVVGTRSCYVFEARDDGGNLTSTVADERDYLDSVEKLVTITKTLTRDDHECVRALHRILRTEIIRTGAGAAQVRRSPELRDAVLSRVRRLLDDVPPTAIEQLDDRNRERVAAIRAGDNERIEGLLHWETGVSLSARLTAARWTDGLLTLSAEVGFVRGGAPISVSQQGARLFARSPGGIAFDVTNQVRTASALLSVRARDCGEEWRVAGQVRTRPTRDGDGDLVLRWFVDLELDPLTIRGGQALRQGIWDVWLTFTAAGLGARCWVGPDRSRAVDGLEPALISGLALIPVWNKRGQLALDAGQSTRSLAAELVRRGAVADHSPGRLVVQLPLHTHGSDDAAEVHVSSQPGRAPTVTSAVVAPTATGATLATTVPATISRVPDVRIRWGGAGSGPAVPVSIATVDGRLAHPFAARWQKLNRFGGMRERVIAQRRRAIRRSKTLTRRAVQLAQHAGLKVSELPPGAVIVSRNHEYGVQRLARDTHLVRRTGGAVAPSLALPGSSGGWLIGGGPLDAEQVGTRAWLVSRPDPSASAEPQLETQTMQTLGKRHVAWLLQRLRVDCVLDVGANDGQYAQELRRHGYTGHVISFDPVPEVATPRELAGGDQIEVPVRRLDAVWDELLAPVAQAGVAAPRVYLKLDTEGFDLEVFRGLGDRVKDVVAMQSEIALRSIREGMPRMSDALIEYERAGFEITGMYPVTRESDGRIIQYDCTMARSETLPS